MRKLSREEQWDSMITLYQDLIDRSSWPIQSMLSLVEAMIACELSKKYYSSSSHASLGISVEEEYEFRLKKPMVYILCDTELVNYDIKFQLGQGNTKHTKSCSIDNLNEVLRLVDNWLGNA